MCKMLGLLILLTGLVFGLSSQTSEINVSVTPCLIVKGEECQIVWESKGTMASRVNITVWIGSIQVAEIPDIENSIYPSSNIRSWQVPETLANGEYIFRVRTIDNQVSGQARVRVNVKGLFIRSGGSRYFYLEKNRFHEISWCGHGLPIASGVKLELYRNDFLVGLIGESHMNNTSNRCGIGFAWKVGHLWNQQTSSPADDMVPSGTGYKIRIQSIGLDIYDETDTFSIVDQVNVSNWIGMIEKGISRIEVSTAQSIPEGCPRCVDLHLQDLIAVLEPVDEKINIVLYLEGKKMASLGYSGSPGGIRGRQRIDFGRMFTFLEKGGRGFELRFFDATKKLVHTQPVILIMRNGS